MSEYNVEELQLTTRCNGSCKLCSRSMTPFDDRNMEIEVVKNLHPYERVSFTGPLGEPSLHPQFNEVVDIVKDKGSHIKVLTNGSTHSTRWWADLGKKLSDPAKDHSLLFPLDGLKENHEKYRGIKFEKTLDNMKAFVGAGGTADCFTIVFEHNEHELDEVEEIAKDLGCRSHRLKVSWWYNTEGSWKRPKNIEMKTRREMAGKIYCTHFHGVWGYKTVSVDITGRLHPCCSLVNQVGQTGVIDRHIRYPKLFIAYLRSHKNLRDLEYAIDSPYFNYVKENMDTLPCAYRCKDSKSFVRQFRPRLFPNPFVDKIVNSIGMGSFIDWRYNDLVNAWSDDQKMSKIWVVTELNKIVSEPKNNILIACGWYSVMAYYVFNLAKFEHGKITSIDKDTGCRMPSEVTNKDYNFTALPVDIFDVTRDYYSHYDMIINTSCEHIDLRKWLDLIPSGTLLALQSTDMDNKEHINCVKDIEEFKGQANLTILYEGEKAINWGKNKRFMLIGIK